MRSFAVASLLASLLAASANATLDPARSNTKGKYPSNPSCSPVKVSNAIQAAECSHNTRTAKQTFAIFTTDHKYDKVNGAPYGTCKAYNCEPGSTMTTSGDSWTFFWNNTGESAGEGAGCIKSPDDGVCGCETSEGTFIPGGSDCV